MAVAKRTESERILAAREQYVPRGIATPPIVVERAEGARVVDVDGKAYIDFAGGLGCQNTGHGFPPAVAAMHEQIDSYLHQCFMVGVYEPYVEVCRRLAELSPCAGENQKSLLLNSGAEAVENAVKIARAATGRPGVIVFDNAFHGRTLLTMTMTHKEIYKQGFGPFAPEVYRAPGPYPYRGVSSDDSLDALAALIDRHEIACVVLEPVQGEGGFVDMPADFPGRLAELCREHGVLYVDDEVQSGIGRTGPVWAIEHYETEPDLLVSGKSLGGGLPLAAVTGRAEVMDAPHPGGLGGTFGGNPVACAAALAVLDEVSTDEFRDARAGARRHDPHPPRRARLPRRPGRRRARHRRDARPRARHRPRIEGARRRPRQAHHRSGAGARPDPPLLRDARQRHPHPRSVGHLRRRSRPGSRDPGGVACRRSRRLTYGSKASGRPTATSSRSTASTSRSPQGEFFTMLGPSGSGKTTTLRLIAGFESPDEGRILLKGADVTAQPPYERDVNTVFQDYALFPHMTVGENVAYGLKIKRIKKAERTKRTAEVLELVRLGGLMGRKPSQLSGGQRQRVALARAIVNHPQVLLLDEPLGALDLKLRQEMQIELKRIQQEVGITFIYVTHDQEEALTMSDRLAVFNDGPDRAGRRARRRSTSTRRPSSSQASWASRTCSSAPERALEPLHRPS